jgi:hypothetical protein
VNEKARTHNAMVLMRPCDTIASSPIPIRQPRGELIPIRIRNDCEAVAFGRASAHTASAAGPGMISSSWKVRVSNSAVGW